MDVSEFKKVGGRKGSNPGGTYRDPVTDARWYIKQARTKGHALNEKLANELYRKVDVPVPEVHLTELNGKPAIASKIIPGAQLKYVGERKDDRVAELKEHFPADAWLSNFDVVGGGSHSNIIVDKSGIAHRIDQGGALRYKPKGKIKGFFDSKVRELQEMKEPGASAAKAFKNTDKQTELPTAERVASVPTEEIAALVAKYGPARRDSKVKLVNDLVSRRDEIAKKYAPKRISRTRLPTKIPPGSFVLPPDILKALGEGDEEAGAQVIAFMLDLGTYYPRLIRPEAVRDLGHGDLQAGRRVLQAFVRLVRQQYAQQKHTAVHVMQTRSGAPLIIAHNEDI